MKHILMLLCLTVLLTACAREDASEATMSVGSEAHASMESAPVMLSQESAMMEGFVVMQDGDVRHNAGSWFDFLEKCRAGESCAVTVVQFCSGADYVRCDLAFDGNDYTVFLEKDGQLTIETCQVLDFENGLFHDTEEPYDFYEAYLLNDIVLYRDLIAQPDYEGVTEIFLHAKEGEPPVKSYTDAASVGPILQLLMTAQYVPAEPENYVYGMKLLMTNRDGQELVIELDLNQGIYRYGMQTYAYGEVSDLFAVLGMEQWPDSVLKEFASFLN